MIMSIAVLAFVQVVSTYAETDPLKPQFHFIPESNWMNDPNAPFYDAETGLYHLMYQYLTPRVWGHAISTNMADWTILNVALNYDEEWYTQVPGETPGVYSGSATIMRGTGEDRSQVWLSASTPTNDMMLLAHPSDLSDPWLERWTWDSLNPVIFANNTNSLPPGRDPTEFWPCGNENDSRWCVAYATQESEGCPCSGYSAIVVFSSVFNASAPMSHESWSAWKFEGYMLNDTADAVMWECVDFFPIDNDGNPFTESVWVMKYSIGPGPSYDVPWGNPGSRDYYVTGLYDPVSLIGFQVNSELWDAAMMRSTEVALDVGAFYASKTFLSESFDRILWGWLPEERPTDSNGDPFGWAGAMSLPRQVLPYVNDGIWMIRTPPVEAVLQSIRMSGTSKTNIEVGTGVYATLNDIEGQQLEFQLGIRAVGMSNGDECGIRVLSSLDSGLDFAEYTDIGIKFHVDSGTGVVNSVSLFVDPSMSCADSSSEVNRTIVFAAPLQIDMLDDYLTVDVQVIVDHSVVEAFIGDGRRAITRRVYPTNPTKSTGVQLYAKCNASGACGQCMFSTVQSWTMRSTNGGASSGSDDKKFEVKSWEIALVIVIPIVFLSAIVAYYFYKKGAPRDLAKEELLCSQSKL